MEPAKPTKCDGCKSLEQKMQEFARTMVHGGNLHQAGDDQLRALFGFDPPTRAEPRALTEDEIQEQKLRDLLGNDPAKAKALLAKLTASPGAATQEG